MSVVTTVLVNVGYADDRHEDDTQGGELFKAINRWLAERECPYPPFTRPTDAPGFGGGNKVMQCELWAGAFNHIQTKDILDAISDLPWGNREDVQIMVQEEQDTRFTIYDLPQLLREKKESVEK